MENSEKGIDRLIKKYLENKMSNIERLSAYQDCPSELELMDYLENRLSPERQELLLEHICDCSHCLSLLNLAQRREEKFKDLPSFEMIKRAKNISRKNSKKVFSNYKWQILACISFILSFVFTRYFLQFLILALILSLKWIFDTGSTRTLIMIYEAWRKKEKGTVQRIIQDFHDKIETRR